MIYVVIGNRSRVILNIFNTSYKKNEIENLININICTVVVVDLYISFNIHHLLQLFTTFIFPTTN
jgi:hypothetical protein